jgi:hypothetical protein
MQLVLLGIQIVNKRRHKAGILLGRGAHILR